MIGDIGIQNRGNMELNTLRTVYESWISGLFELA